MIREAEEKEYGELIRIAEEDGFEHPRKINLLWIQNRSILGDRFYLYEENNKILGFVCFQPEFSNGSRLHYISVRKSEQGKGVGSALLEEVEKMTVKHEKSKLYLWVHQKNKQAIKFYLKHDFDFAGIFINKYGEGENALLMCKELK
jgi:ribosomal-protein-alanine N-acetyltransferase